MHCFAGETWAACYGVLLFESTIGERMAELRLTDHICFYFYFSTCVLPRNWDLGRLLDSRVAVGFIAPSSCMFYSLREYRVWRNGVVLTGEQLINLASTHQNKLYSIYEDSSWSPFFDALKLVKTLLGGCSHFSKTLYHGKSWIIFQGLTKRFRVEQQNQRTSLSPAHSQLTWNVSSWTRLAKKFCFLPIDCMCGVYIRLEFAYSPSILPPFGRCYAGGSRGTRVTMGWQLEVALSLSNSTNYASTKDKYSVST